MERVEDLEKRVAGLVHKVDETAQVHEKRLREAVLTADGKYRGP